MDFINFSIYRISFHTTCLCGGNIEIENNIRVEDTARIAVYDDLLSAPRVIDVPPQGVNEYIEAIASTTYELSHQQGGSIPYTVIREITENFIHAGFLECTVSVLEEGNTLRFADQGPGIAKKEQVLKPGISSASREMKEYIRGVGSGFPIVREYLSSSHGYMNIEDNAEDGVVVTISLVMDTPPLSQEQALPFTTNNEKEIKDTTTINSPFSFTKEETSSHLKTDVSPFSLSLKEREKRALLLLNEYGILGPVDLADLLNVSAPTTTRLLQKLEQLGLVESTQLKKRILSNAGMMFVQELLLTEA